MVANGVRLVRKKPFNQPKSALKARSQAGVMGAITSSVGPIAPSGASLGTPCRYHVGIYAYNVHTCFGAKLCCTAAPRLLIFSSHRWHQQCSVRLKLCCTAAPRLLIFFSLDGTSSVRLKLCCTAVSRLLIFSSLDGSSCVRLKLCCTAMPIF